MALNNNNNNDNMSIRGRVIIVAWLHRAMSESAGPAHTSSSSGSSIRQHSLRPAASSLHILH